VITLVQNAQSGKSEAQALADRVAGIFVPVVLAIAALTFAAWMVFGPAPALSHALVSAVSVLVAACPCAMGLATPAALVVSTGRAAELGVLLRKTSALDVLARVDTVVLDKTGTLTRGAPAVTKVKSFVAGADTSEPLALAAAVEARSEHPVGRAILAYAKASPEASRALGALVLESFRSIPGGGAEGRVSGREVLVGKPDRLASRGLLDGIDEASRTGTSAFVAIDGKVVLGFVVEDEQRPEAKKAIAALRELAIVPILASGDAEGPVTSLARELGSDEAHAAETPTSKAARVTTLHEAKKTVAFVGDGVNDAAALAVADVGIAMGTGSDVAVSAGDVVLVRSDLFAFVDAVRLARSTKRVVSENFFWAYAYNAALIPLAAGALEPWLGLSLSPMLASTAMAASSLFVLGNSLRLKRFRRSERA
jgi:Cu+-exporting ATPase